MEILYIVSLMFCVIALTIGNIMLALAKNNAERINKAKRMYYLAAFFAVLAVAFVFAAACESKM